MDSRAMDIAKLRAESDFAEMMERFQVRFAGGRTWLTGSNQDLQSAQAPLQLLSGANLMGQSPAPQGYPMPTSSEPMLDDELDLEQ